MTTLCEAKFDPFDSVDVEHDDQAEHADPDVPVIVWGLAA
jgi:hypothetical protein